MKLENKIAEELKRVLDKLGYEIKLDEIVIEHSKTKLLINLLDLSQKKSLIISSLKKLKK